MDKKLIGKKRIITLSIIIILIIAFAVLFTACEDKSMPLVESITVSGLPGSIIQYDEWDLTDAKITVKYSDGNIEEEDLSTDLISGYDNSVAGKQTITINYGGKTCQFELNVIEKMPDLVKTVENANITLGKTDYGWTGHKIEPEVTVIFNGEQLYKDIDYIVSYRNNVDLGDAEVIISGQGEFTGNNTKHFSIIKQLIDASEIEAGEVVYNGTAQLPIFIKGNSELFEIKNEPQIYAGNYRTEVIIKDKEHYAWLGQDNFEINWTIKKAIVQAPTNVESEFIYDCTEKTVVLQMSDKCEFITNGIYKNRATDAGNYAAAVHLKDDINYSWADNTVNLLIYNWNIQKRVIPIIELPNYYYDGTVKNCDYTEIEDYVSVDGIFHAVNSGEYSVSFELKYGNNLIWEDGTRNKLNLEWNIYKRDIKKPIYVEQNFVYTGKEQKINIRSDNSFYILENYMESAAGDYKAIAKLKDKENLQWEDGTKDDLNFCWAIANFDFSEMAEIKLFGTYSYTGIAIEPEYKVVFNESGQEVPSEWYSVAFYDNTNAGIGKVIISANNKSCRGSLSVNFTIEKCVLTILAKASQVDTSTAGGVEFAVAPIVDENIYTVIVSYDGNEEIPAKGQNIPVTISLIIKQEYQNNYESSEIKIFYSVGGNDIGTAVIEIEQKDFVYSGDTIMPAVGSVVYNGSVLKTSDYKVEYENNIAATKNALVRIIGRGEYVGYAELEFEIKRRPVAKPVAENTRIIYRAEKINLVNDYNDIFYAVSGNNYIDVGQYNAAFSLYDNYIWEDNSIEDCLINWEIIPIDLSAGHFGFNLSNDTFVYDGSIHQPELQNVYANGISLTENVDYEVSDNQSCEIGIYNITVRGISDNVTGEYELLEQYEIVFDFMSAIELTGIKNAKEIKQEKALIFAFAENEQRDIVFDFTAIPQKYTVTVNYNNVKDRVYSLNMSQFKDIEAEICIVDNEKDTWQRIKYYFFQPTFIDADDEKAIGIKGEEGLSLEKSDNTFYFYNGGDMHKIVDVKTAGDIFIKLKEGYKFKLYYDNIALSGETPLIYGRQTYTLKIFSELNSYDTLEEKQVEISYYPGTDYATDIIYSDMALGEKNGSISFAQEQTSSFTNQKFTANNVTPDSDGTVLFGLRNGRYTVITVCSGIAETAIWENYAAFRLTLSGENNTFMFSIKDTGNIEYTIIVSINTNCPFNPVMYADTYFESQGVIGEIREEGDMPLWGEIPMDAGLDYAFFYQLTLPYEAAEKEIEFNFICKNGFYLKRNGSFLSGGMEMYAFEIYTDEQFNSFYGNFVVIYQYKDYNSDASLDITIPYSLGQRSSVLSKENEINVAKNAILKFETANQYAAIDFNDSENIIKSLGNNEYILTKFGTITAIVTSSDKSLTKEYEIVFNEANYYLEIYSAYDEARLASVKYTYNDDNNDGEIIKEEIAPFGDAVLTDKYGQEKLTAEIILELSDNQLKNYLSNGYFNIKIKSNVSLWLNIRDYSSEILNDEQLSKEISLPQLTELENCYYADFDFWNGTVIRIIFKLI